MNGKTHYMILGVSRAESAGGIRAAYRELAKKLHPDVAGQQATHAFQELSEAYDVLSDPQRRREYESELRRVESSGGALIRPGPAAPIARAPVSILSTVDSVRPSFEEMYDRFLSNFTGVGIPKSEHLEGLNIEVVLTHEEARHGCVLPVGVPAFRRCPYCGGSGRDWLFPCLSCQQQGMIEDEEILRVRIPALVRSGSIYEMPLQGLGIQNFYLRLHVFVEPYATDERR